jgi:serine/threonine protein kinase
LSVAGRYEVQRPLGHGAMAVVDLAHDVRLGRHVALKRLAENLARDEELRSRFLREARLAARIAHPNVVRIYDVGEDGDRPFIAMEYVEGETLAELLVRKGPLSPDDVVQLGVQACRGLAAAHEAGLVHRDVKPQNLLLRSDGVLKLGDFGVAFGLDGTRLTMAGTVLGTAAYLAPEQARGEEVSAAADVYALGAVLYELLTGRPPRTASTLAELAEPATIAPPAGVPAPLSAVVMRCLAAAPHDRPGSAAQLARELAATTPEGSTLPLPDHPSQRATEIKAPPRRFRNRLRPAALLAAGAAAAVVIGVAAALSTRSSPQPAPTPPAQIVPVPHVVDAGQQARELARWLRRHSR